MAVEIMTLAAIEHAIGYAFAVAIYFGWVAVPIVLAIIWRNALTPQIEGRRMQICLAAMVAAYVLGQVVLIDAKHFADGFRHGAARATRD